MSSRRGVGSPPLQAAADAVAAAAATRQPRLLPPLLKQAEKKREEEEEEKEHRMIKQQLRAFERRVVAALEQATRRAEVRDMLTWADVEEVLSLPPGFRPRRCPHLPPPVLLPPPPQENDGDQVFFPKVE